MSQQDASRASGSNYNQPSEDGHFGIFGGRFVAETLTAALDELAALYTRMQGDAEFQRDLDRDLAQYVGRPSPLYLAEHLTTRLGGA
ncbi:MAG: tryptophan synthase subunit beta, partial [Gammaproteobacteria bacterium]|nr:tryptophan synthase subunit beta [Gammaproteobacteria bacterium]